MRKGRRPYEVRKAVVEAGLKFIQESRLTNSTAVAKLFYLFTTSDDRYKKIKPNHRELSLILHSDKIDYDGRTGNPKPSHEAISQTHREIQLLRKHNNAVLLYAIRDEDTKEEYYENITTLQLYEIIMKKAERVIKGFRKMHKDAMRILELTDKEKAQLNKNYEQQIIKDQMDKMARQLDEKRKQELEEIFESKQKERLLKRKKNTEDQNV